MKKIFCFLFLSLILNNCSFDNKTGIWNDSEKIVKKSSNKEKDISELENNKDFKFKCLFKKQKEDFEECVTGKKKALADSRYELVFTGETRFNEEKDVTADDKILIGKAITNNNWLDEFYSANNNISNIYYKNDKDIFFKSSRLAKFNSLKSLKFDNYAGFLVRDENIISFDQKGTIYVYSPSLKKKLFQFNFYQNQFKKYKKNIFFAAKGENIYISDNLGYMYAININDQKLIWARNFGVPFRSNIKIIDNQIILANQDNVIFSVNTSDGETNWQFSTSTSILKSNFINNIALDLKNDLLFFLNTNGELYSINYLSQKINWVINNAGPSSTDGSTSIFKGTPISLKDTNLIFSSEKYLFKYDGFSGSRIWSRSINSLIKPIITPGNIFLISSDNLLICLDFISGEVIWSKNIFNQLSSSKPQKAKKKYGNPISLIIANGELNLFTNNGYIISFNSQNGNISYKDKITSGFSAKPIFVEGYLYLLDKNSKLHIYN